MMSLSPSVQRSVLCLNWLASQAAASREARVLIEAQVHDDWTLARMTTENGSCR